jgi:two-component system sensor histidine kinase PilS (NtrC family)
MPQSQPIGTIEALPKNGVRFEEARSPRFTSGQGGNPSDLAPGVFKTHAAPMDRRLWLLRLILVRIAVFSVFLIAELFMRRAAPAVDMLVLLGAVWALSACWFALLEFSIGYVWQSYAQIAVDLLFITWTINRTGGVDSYFAPLYFLEIVISSILLQRRGAFITATAASVIHFAHIDLAYLRLIPSTAITWPDFAPLQYILILNVFGFCSVAFLSNVLSENLRRTGAQLEKSSDQVEFLRDFSDRIVERIGSGLMTTDPDGRIYLFNRAAGKITGWTEGEALGMTMWQVFPGMQPTVDSTRFELVTTRRDGNEMYLHFSVSPVMIDEKKTAGYVWSFEDLTELRQLEQQMQQKEQMAALGTMSAGIAHEIRNPLASITGSFKLLKADLRLSPDQQSLADIISREADRLNRTITDFLAYARPATPRPGLVDLSELISETVRLMRNSSEVKTTHKIETNLSALKADVDENMMRQVFYNLASNAFKAMPDGGTLTIVLERHNGNIQIRFEDTGVGLTRDDMKKLFVPFHSSFSSGTGLGLPIVYQIVSAHNGVISVKSRKGVGTSFIIDL